MHYRDVLTFQTPVTRCRVALPPEPVPESSPLKEVSAPQTHTGARRRTKGAIVPESNLFRMMCAEVPSPQDEQRRADDPHHDRRRRTCPRPAMLALPEARYLGLIVNG